MNWRACVSCGAVAVFVLVAPVTAAAKLAPIRGTLSAPGYTVIALAASGKATSARARHGSFTLRSPAGRVTLQLRGANGIYAGPVLIGSAEKGRHAIVGVRAGARLGRITVNARRGYAKVARRVAKRWVDTSRWARARKGVPIGAGNFGRVRSKPPRASPPGDLDADGVPDRLDVDINGNLILNNVDRSTRSRAIVAQTPSQFFLSSAVDVPLWDAVNADAAAVTEAAINGALSKWDTLALGILPGSPELDCGGAPDPNNPQGWIGGLSYCTRGGTGTALLGPPGSPYQPFPACCDPDGNGFGTLPNNSGVPPPGAAFFFKPGATTSQIGTGDVLIQRVTSNGIASDTATMVPYIFATVPALVSYDDGQGNSATVNYPVAGPPGRTGPGTPGNAFPVAAGPNGVALRLTFWRPQRKPIPPETGAWTDIGKLGYGASIQSVGASNPSRACPPSAFSTNDPNLSGPVTLPQNGQNAGGVTDLAPDQPTNPANTITYTLNVTNCLAALGLVWNPGEDAIIHPNAVTDSAPSSQAGGPIVFERR